MLAINCINPNNLDSFKTPKYSYEANNHQIDIMGFTTNQIFKQKLKETN